MRTRILTGALWMVLFAWLASVPATWAQEEDEIQSLIDDRAEEEAELNNIPGANIPGLDNDIVSGKVRMPSGEEVERLREAGGLMQAEELAQVLEWLEMWTQDPEAARTIGEAGRLALESGRGAAQSTVVALQERGLLPSSRGDGPAPQTAP